MSNPTKSTLALAAGAILLACLPILLDLLTTHEVVKACETKGEVQLHSYRIKCEVIK